MLLYYPTVGVSIFIQTLSFFITYQEAVNTTNNFFNHLKEDPPRKSDINILAATQELEAFAINYGKTHYKVNESKVFSQEQFGECFNSTRG